ncbi:MAG: hypothetical protein HY231_15975 [Acidobacteria bacterium]|nr:hypothetical protein [Acidobacteriota bacterium]
MSEDETKILKEESEDSPAIQKAPTTHPMLEAILARVVDLSDAFHAFRDEVNEKFDQVNEKFNQVNGKFDQVNGKFDQVKTKLDTLTVEVREMKRNQRIFHEDLLKLQGANHDLEDRVDDLERKAL